MSTESAAALHPFLQLYGNDYHAWKVENLHIFHRRVGFVENSFHADGRYYEGRADMHSTLTLEIRSSLTEPQLEERILAAWAILRLQHPLLLATIRGDTNLGEEPCYVVAIPQDPATASLEARSSVTSLKSHVYLDAQDLVKHALNTGRMLDHTKYLSRIFILPLEPLANGNAALRFLQISAHTITDGLSMHNWTSTFIDLLNKSPAELETALRRSLDVRHVAGRLPPAQEDLYPQVPGNKARRRWFWAIIRILRHVRKPLPSGFVNPLRRKEPTHITLDEKFPHILDYSRRPPNSGGYTSLSLSPSASQRLINLCREAQTTIGAGCFAFNGLIMMELEEQLHPDIPLAERSPFVGSFPLNPRPFFNYEKHDSCMLAFSDGLVLPFLSSTTNLERRFKVLAKSAHRQLRSYQKRPRKGLDSHSPLRMVATNYLLAIERREAKLPEQYRTGLNPQGAYPASWSFSLATCGVSNMGSVKDWLTPGKYPLDDGDGKDLIADFRDVAMGVRARETEFLVGSWGFGDGLLRFGVSYDATLLDPELVERWKEKMETIFEMD